MIRHDVVIIGGSLAGAACVRELERRGIDAIAFERDRFPRQKVCGGFLSPGAVEGVRRLGLFDEVLKAGAVVVRSARVRVGGIQSEIPFERPGLGISRAALDAVFAQGARVQQGCGVSKVERANGRFVVDGIHCSAVIDASGKLGRFSKRQSVDEFGVQYLEPGPKEDVLDFHFFEDGYGGSVSIEGGRSNSCFLIRKEALRRYVDHADCLITGPLAYNKLPGEFIAIGDAVGMIDPFCGEGMRHAIETGVLAARVVANGIRRRARYEEMKLEYESEWERRWMLRRMMGAGLRKVVARPFLCSVALRAAPPRVLNAFWNRTA
jgi:flavin-dependent dehydrogenase